MSKLKHFNFTQVIIRSLSNKFGLDWTQFRLELLSSKKYLNKIEYYVI